MYKKHVVTGIVIFETAYHISPIFYLKKYVSRKWGIKGRIIYLILPFVFEMVNLLGIIQGGCFFNWDFGVFTYVRDVSNSIVLTVLFPLSYYLLGFYSFKFEDSFQKYVDKNFYNEVYQLYEKSWSNTSKKLTSFAFLLIVFITSASSVIVFFGTAARNSSAAWITSLSSFSKCFYCVFLFMTWYISLILLIMVLTAGCVVYGIIKENAFQCFGNSIESVSSEKFSELLLYNFSYGILYVGGAIVFIVNDIVSFKLNHVRNTFASEGPAIIMMAVVTVLVTIAYIPLQEMNVYMLRKRDALASELEYELNKDSSIDTKIIIAQERHRLSSQTMINISVGNKLMIFSSIFIPTITVVIQIVQLLVNVL